MILNNIKAIGIHFVITLVLLFIIPTIQNGNIVLDTVISISVYLSYVILGFFFLNSTLRPAIASVPSVVVISLLVTATFLAGGGGIVALYASVNSTPVLIINELLQLDLGYQSSAPYLFAAVLPSLFMFMGISVKRLITNNR